MKNIFISFGVLSAIFILMNCGSHSHEHKHSENEEIHSHSGNHRHEHSDDCEEHSHEHAANAHEENHETLSYTVYDDMFEVYIEADRLHEGKETCVLAHITKLHDFKPLDSAEIIFSLFSDGKSKEYKAAALMPGVYEFHAVPEKGGNGKLVCKIPVSNGCHEVEIPVEICDHSAHEQHVSGETHEHGFNMVSFPKEQSWKMDFRTDSVSYGKISAVVKGVAKVSNVPENITSIVAAASGKVYFGSVVAPGREVKNGEALFTLETGDVTDGNIAIKYAEAESRYNYAKAEYERKSELVKTKIVSLGDFQAAETAYIQAKAVYENLKKNFKSGKLSLKSPFSGYISDIAVKSGDFVTEGMPLATIQRDGDMLLFCEVSVRHASVLKKLSDAVVELENGTFRTLEELQGRIIAVGRGVQNDCNMIPVTLLVKNLDAAPGSLVKINLLSETEEKGIMIPRSALVEEMGKFFVFVQHTPELFEKRSVVPGVTNGQNIRIISGLDVGERVVTVGSISLKLSQGAGALDPHAGHVH